jgi:hypothetical protein
MRAISQGGGEINRIAAGGKVLLGAAFAWTCGPYSGAASQNPLFRSVMQLSFQRTTLAERGATRARRDGAPGFCRISRKPAPAP